MWGTALLRWTKEGTLDMPWVRTLLITDSIHVVQSRELKPPASSVGSRSTRDDKETRALTYFWGRQNTESDIIMGLHVSASATGSATTWPQDGCPASSTEVKTHQAGGWYQPQ